MPKLPNQRWEIAPEQTKLASRLAKATGLLPLLGQVLINRGIQTVEQAQLYLNPDTLVLPSPTDEFTDLVISIELLSEAIAHHQKIAICGDYDADGMTSTALLLRALRWLGADVDYAIPSRMKDGYGINNRIVEEFHNEGIQVILTVDNGISALEPIELARELGMDIIITDHHDLPPILPEANAILNPKLLPESSPYRGLAGVGVAYILAVSLAQKMGKLQGLTAQLLELFTLGTIADLAPLTGVNRRWLKRGLLMLPESKLAGIKALISIAGVKNNKVVEPNLENQAIETTTYELKNPSLSEYPANNNAINSVSMKPEDIGFRLGPRINAIGRIGDPQIVIDLLTTEDDGIALEKAMQCEQINQERQRLCQEIEQEAIAWCEASQIDLLKERVLVIVQPNWHHGVIGIVASRLVERYGVPVFIGTYEQEEQQQEEEKKSTTKNKKTKKEKINNLPTSETDNLSVTSASKSVSKTIRGSARGIREFNIFAALQYCQDLLGKFGGHQAAGGFSFPTDNLEKVRSRLSEFANKCLEPHHLKPLLEIDATAQLNQINLKLYEQIDSLHPCGIGNPDPIFLSTNVRVIEQQILKNSHIKLTLSQNNYPANIIKAIAWRWSEYFPLPSRLDIAYKLKENVWHQQKSIELELVGARASEIEAELPNVKKAEFYHQDRHYTCSMWESLNELRIRNTEGKVLAVQQGQKTGLLGTNRENAQTVDITQPHFYQLIKAALNALN